MASWVLSLDCFPICGDQIGHEAKGAAVFLRHNHCSVDTGYRFQGRLNFAKLNPEASNLDLVVDAAEEVDVTVG